MYTIQLKVYVSLHVLRNRTVYMTPYDQEFDIRKFTQNTYVWELGKGTESIQNQAYMKLVML